MNRKFTALLAIPILLAAMTFATLHNPQHAFASPCQSTVWIVGSTSGWINNGNSTYVEIQNFVTVDSSNHSYYCGLAYARGSEKFNGGYTCDTVFGWLKGYGSNNVFDCGSNGYAFGVNTSVFSATTDPIEGDGFSSNGTGYALTNYYW